jgi:hypothetical protein
MAAVITPEHPASPEATALIAELDAHLTPLYPSESRHGSTLARVGLETCLPCASLGLSQPAGARTSLDELSSASI